MALSTQRVVSDGTLTLLSLSIDYFDRADITVLFDNVQRLPGNGWNWVGTTDKKISFTPAVPVNVEVKLKRTTVMSLPRHQYTSGAQFVAETLDENFKQVLYVAQETSEGGALTEVFNDLDMHGFRLRRIGTAQLDDEAVSLAQYKADANGANAAKVAAQAAQTAADASKTAAATSETNALASKNAAAASATNAATSETNALTSKNAAATSATNAATSESNALTSKNSAAASLTDFKNRYQGALATAPTTRTDGSALQTGDLYYDTALLVLRIRTATPGWADAASANTYTKAESDAKYPLASDTYSKDQSANLGARNRIINGSCFIDQRNDGAVSTVSGYTTVDRWNLTIGSNGGAISAQRVKDGPNADLPYSLKVVATTANATGTNTNGVHVYQHIEKANILDFEYGTAIAKAGYLSFWVKSSVVGKYSVFLYHAGGAAGVVRTQVQNFTINAANTWELKVVSFVADTAASTWQALAHSAAGLLIGFDLGSASGRNTPSPGTWVENSAGYVRTSDSVNMAAVLNATFQLTGVQFESGQATRFEYELPQTTLLKCRRYYFKGYLPLRGYAASASSFNRIASTLPTVMRVAPLPSIYGTPNVWDGGTVTSVSTVSSNSSTVDCIEFDGSTAAAALTAGRIVMAVNNSQGGFIANAEY